mgnify:CR=1 FL=1
MNYLDYLRTDKFPHFWCSGCGNGIVLCAIARAFEELDLTLENTVVVTRFWMAMDESADC